MSASHTIQAGSDLFIGKDEAIHHEEGNVNVLNLFVKVPPSAVAPSKYKPTEADAINQVADGREQRRRVAFHCCSSTF